MRYSNQELYSNELLWNMLADTKDKEIRNEIVTRNMGLAQYVANRYRARAPEHQSIEDIVSYAYEGLIDSVEKFDPAMGYQFPTYAVRRISGAILDGLRKEDPLPRSARKRVKDYEVVASTLFEMTGREPSQKEIAEWMRITEEELGYIQRDSQSQFKFLDAQDVPATIDTRHDDPELHSEVADLAEHIAIKLSRLPESERNFVLAHYGKGLSLTELAGILEVSESRLTQMRRSVVDSITGG
jgi:RNA polymerase sigma factor for flagellar operon FliA